MLGRRYAAKPFVCGGALCGIPFSSSDGLRWYVGGRIPLSNDVVDAIYGLVHAAAGVLVLAGFRLRFLSGAASRDLRCSSPIWGRWMQITFDACAVMP